MVKTVVQATLDLGKSFGLSYGQPLIRSRLSSLIATLGSHRVHEDLDMSITMP